MWESTHLLTQWRGTIQIIDIISRNLANAFILVSFKIFLGIIYIYICLCFDLNCLFSGNVRYWFFFNNFCLVVTKVPWILLKHLFVNMSFSQLCSWYVSSFSRIKNWFATFSQVVTTTSKYFLLISSIIYGMALSLFLSWFLMFK